MGPADAALRGSCVRRTTVLQLTCKPRWAARISTVGRDGRPRPGGGGASSGAARAAYPGGVRVRAACPAGPGRTRRRGPCRPAHANPCFYALRRSKRAACRDRDDRGLSGPTAGWTATFPINRGTPTRYCVHRRIRGMLLTPWTWCGPAASRRSHGARDVRNAGVARPSSTRTGPERASRAAPFRRGRNGPPRRYIGVAPATSRRSHRARDVPNAGVARPA